MVFRSLAQTASALALLATLTEGFNVYVLNRCTVDIQLAHVTMTSINLETLGVGKTLVRNVPLGSPSHVFKAGAGAQATRAFASPSLACARRWRHPLSTSASCRG